MQIAGPIDHPSAWTAASLGSPEALAFELGKPLLDEFERAIEPLAAAGTPVEDTTRADYPVGDGVAKHLARLQHEMDHGRGFALVQGFPVGDWPTEAIEYLYWGIGTHLGRATTQSVLGDRLGHVRDMSAEDSNARAYRNHQELRLHNDLSEYICMLSLASAARGGASRYASMVAIHNIMLDEGPEHLVPLYRGFHTYRLGEEGPGELPYTPHRVPVFSFHEGHLSGRYIRGFITAGATLRGEPLTDEEIAALDCLDAVAHRPDVMIERTLAPGEATFLNNQFIMHARTAFEDDPASGIRRHLLRLWLEPAVQRPTVPELELFPEGGIPEQPGQSPSGEGDLLRGLGATDFAIDEVER